ncbi:hypothetical protein ACEYX6_04430 [Acinetobacter sp. c2-A9]|uniref:hypothetical protein n=1 Tax=Acinetobacter sp. c2-A9 TaxID=3342802 RepID=UPI0035B90C7C
MAVYDTNGLWIMAYTLLITFYILWYWKVSCLQNVLLNNSLIIKNMKGDVIEINNCDYAIENIIPKGHSSEDESHIRICIYFEGNTYFLFGKKKYKEELLCRLDKVLGNYLGEKEKIYGSK